MKIAAKYVLLLKYFFEKTVQCPHAFFQKVISYFEFYQNSNVDNSNNTATSIGPFTNACD